LVRNAGSSTGGVVFFSSVWAAAMPKRLAHASKVARKRGQGERIVNIRVNLDEKTASRPGRRKRQVVSVLFTLSFDETKGENLT
jgi:hypothetical protein